VRRARRVLEELDTSEQELQHLDPDPKGTRRVTAPTVLGRARVLPVIMAFQHRFPAVRVLFDATDRMVDLVSEQVDVAVRTVAEPRRRWSRAGSTTTCVTCAPARPTLLPADCPRRWPIWRSTNACRAAFHGEPAPWRFKAGNGAVKALQVDGRLHLSDSFSIRDAVLSGAGIADLPEYLVARDLAEGQLVRVLESVPRVIRGVYVVYAPSPFTPTKVRLFVDALKTHFKLTLPEARAPHLDS